ncbi:ABC transporter substrate-binding protein [Microbacterium sp. RD1]|uniref:ABC transporter substrate-binding protein n=1 Tax=Microbacterium sp. RD1 TaxID=3457313 RepID=UPI003FA5C95E
MQRVSRGGVVAGVAALALVLATACTPIPDEDDGTTSDGSAFPVNINDGGEPQTGGTLHMLGTADVDFMDPNVSYNYIGYLGQRMWARQLLTYPAEVGKTTTPVPDIVTEVPSLDNGGVTDGGATVSLTIKDGVNWNTEPARQVTAADAVRAVKRTCNPARPFGGVSVFQSLIVGMDAYCEGYASVDPESAVALAEYQNTHEIEGVSVSPDNPLTVVFRLTTPASYFVDMLAMPAFSPAPQEYDQFVPGSPELAQNTVANGPYRIASYSPTREIVFERNPAWESATDDVRKAYVDAIVVNQTGNAQTIQTQLQAGSPTADMEWNTYPPNSVVPSLITAKDPNLNLTPNLWSSPYLAFNTVSPNNDEALASVEVRQALSRAIDRQNLTVDLSGPQISPPLTHVLPAGFIGSDSNTEPSYYPFDPEQAESTLADAGHDAMTLKVLYQSDSSTSKSVFLTIQQNLEKVGVKVEAVTATNAEFYTKYLLVPGVAQDGVWDIAIAQWGPDWYGDAAKSLFAPLFYGNDGEAGSSFPPNGLNYGFYNNPEVDALIEEASAEADADRAAELWAETDQLIMEDAAIYPITSPTQPTYHASHVHNTIVIPMFSQVDPTNVWLSKD